MAIHEFLVCAVNESEDHRKKEGDIIAVRPHGWCWGLKELSRCLVVLVEDDRSSEELNDLVAEVTYENHQKESESQRLKKLIKFKLKMPLTEIKKINTEVDLDKARNPSFIYQPFKTTDDLIKKFDGKNGNRFLNHKDVDTGLNADKEFIINKIKAPKLIIEKNN